MTTIYKYKIYCETEGITHNVLNEKEIPPTKCPVDSNHTINPNSIYLFDKIEPTEVSIKEETIKTGGHFRVQDLYFDCPANQETTYEFSFPVNISVLAFKMVVRPDMEGDKLHAVVSPNTVVGFLTATASIDDDQFTVSESVIANVFVGMVVDFYDAVNDISIDCGQILDIDIQNNIITTENKTTREFNIGDQVRIGICMVKNVEFPKITNDYSYEVGTSKIGASHLPKGTKTKIFYTNSTNEAKKCHIFYEYLY